MHAPAHTHMPGHTQVHMHVPAHVRTHTHTQICNIYCFSTAAMICELASLLRYTYIVSLAFPFTLQLLCSCVSTKSVCLFFFVSAPPLLLITFTFLPVFFGVCVASTLISLFILCILISLPEPSLGFYF